MYPAEVIIIIIFFVPIIPLLEYPTYLYIHIDIFELPGKSVIMLEVVVILELLKNPTKLSDYHNIQVKRSL